jgi:apolipoprotein N-acyltransferase
VRVAVVQANIPQELKWERSSWPSIMEKYLALTKEVVLEKPELIIWPETAFPGFLWEDPVLFEELKQFVAHHGIPLLLGVVTQEEESYYNSALLISERGEVIQQYNKLHLVPFGEYIPWRQFFPFLSQIVPIADFSSGREYTLFPIPKKNNQARDKEPGEKKFFSVVICFEDTVARLVRGFARQGSSLLVNITNDAWFQDTKAPFMHLAASLLRSIEMRKSLIRAANTGVSCFIDPHGRILKCVHNEHNKKTYVAGYAIQEVPLNLEKTFYTKFGDIFTYLCFGCILGGIILEKQVRL